MFRDRKDELLNLNSKYLQRVLAESNITYVEGETRSQVELLDVLVVPFVKMLSPASSDRNRADSIHIDSRQRIQPSSLRDGTSFSENPISSTPESQSTFPLLFALKENKYINLLGEPGSGKSTALKFVAISLIRGASGFSTETDDGTIPILLSLREYSETIQQKGLRESLVDQVMRVGFFNRGEADLYFEFLWNNRRIILLLDGLDEIHELVRPEVIKEIYRFVNATKHKGFPVIVTSRLSGYENLGENFAEYLISSLNDPKQLHKFISRWLSAIKGFDKNNGKDLKQETLGIISDLSLNNGVSGITNNPLHLQMIISTYSRTGEVLPKRTDLYQDYCEKIAWERGISRTPPPESRANCIEALEIIAWSILAKSKTVTQDISVSIQSEVEDVSNVDALLTFLIDGMGLISKYTDGRKEKLFFIRQNFMEYFAAVRLSKIHKKDPKLTWKFIKPRLHSQAWREPILLFTNMLDLESATRFVTKIWKAKSS
jgi:predicted NACHT family NTPase